MRLTTPSNAGNYNNVTLHIKIEHSKIIDLACNEGGYCQWMDELIMDDGRKYTGLEHINMNYTPPTQSQSYRYDGTKKIFKWKRKVSIEDVRAQNLDLMPGIRFSWHYSGMEVKPESPFSTSSFYVKTFVRNSSNKL